jgi:hypothetical protein
MPKASRLHKYSFGISSRGRRAGLAVKVECRSPGRSGTARHQRIDVDFCFPVRSAPSEQTSWRSVCEEGAPTSAQPEQRVFIFSLRFAEAAVEIKQLGGLLVKVLTS